MGVVQDRWADSRSDVIDPRRCQMFPSLIPYAAARCLEPIRWPLYVATWRTYMRRTTCACINLCTPSQRLRPLCRLAVHDMAIQQPWLDCLVPWVGKSVLDGFCPPLTIARPPDRVQVALNTKLRLIVTKEANNSAFLFLSCRQGLHWPRFQPCCYTTSGLLSNAVHQSLSSDHHC